MLDEISHRCNCRAVLPVLDISPQGGARSSWRLLLSWMFRVVIVILLYICIAGLLILIQKSNMARKRIGYDDSHVTDTTAGSSSDTKDLDMIKEPFLDKQDPANNKLFGPVLDKYYPMKKLLDPKLGRHGVKKKRLPQAIIVGVKKCGTGTLKNMLREHPQIVAPFDETAFFEKNHTYSKGLEWYRNEMPQSYKDQITIEKTPEYFIYPWAHQRIHNMNSSIKLILIVKDPADRVLSDYTHNIAEGYIWDGTTFEEQTLGNDGEVDPRKYAVNPSMYATHTAGLLELFSREQLLVLDGDILIKDPLTIMKKVEKFLDIAPWFSEKILYFNEKRGFYCLKSRCMPSYSGRKHPDVNPGVMSKLRRFFAPHNKIFYDLIGYDFGWPTY